MKVIFLDNDGVICLSNNWGSRLKKQKKLDYKPEFNDNNQLPVEYRFDNFDVKAVKILNQILETTGAEIVVSSDWRLHASLDEIGEYYTSKGIIKKPIGFTEVFHYTNWLEEGRIPSDFDWNRTDGREQERHFEIKDWLKSHPEVTHWVAVDDLHMGIHVAASSYGPYDRDWGLENFVWTPRDCEGIKQNGIKQKIIKYLSHAS
jgi:hypothetical protein